MVRTETFWGSAIMLVGVAGVAALGPFVDNGDPARAVTGGMVTNSCAGDGGDVVTATSADEPSPLGCEVSRYFQESVTADRSFVVQISDRQVCYPARQVVRINPEASSPTSVTAWTVEECT